jgi:hypothetical protein
MLGSEMQFAHNLFLMGGAAIPCIHPVYKWGAKVGRIGAFGQQFGR